MSPPVPDTPDWPPTAPPVLADHPIAHLVIAPDGACLGVNTAARRLLGYDSGGTRCPASWRALVHADAHDRTGQLPDDGSWPLRHAGGHAVPVTASVLRYTHEGRPLLLVVLADGRDASQVKAALEASATSFRQLAENVPGAIFRYEIAPDGSDTVLYMSPGCLDLWELRAEDLVEDASQLWAMVDPDDLPAMQASVMQSAQSLAPWLHEWRITTPSGRRKWLQGTGRPERLPDGGTRWNSFILDVTERHEAEVAQRRLRAELRQAQRLESLGRLAGGIAHDFNNLLTVIIGFGESALDGVAADGDVAADIRELLAAGERSADLTRQLLSFARRQPASPKVVNVAEQLETSAAMLRRLIGERVLLDYQVAPDTPSVFLDPVQLDQIVTNLVINARDALPDGGRVSVSATRSGNGDGASALRLVVADEGEGMDDETLARVFEPFFTTKEDGAGTGLGLATVYGIVQQAGGRVAVESALGAGTRVTVSLPAVSAEAVSAAAPGDATRTAGRAEPGEVALVVEDDAQLRKLTSRQLEEAGYAVRAVADADGALALLAAPGAPTPAVLVCDVVLPGMSGADLAARLRGDHPQLAVVFVTGYVMDDRLRRLLESIAAPRLLKPFSGVELREAVQQARMGSAA